jgi:hypothetical protein
MIKYAGIGSRKTPEEICDLMFRIAKTLAGHDHLLRSGHARGADISFENGCDSVKGKKEIFKGNTSVDKAALDLAEKYHPAWNNCDFAAMKLHARNGYIILGPNLNDPVDFIIAYAPGGFEYGGTSQGLRIARDYGITIHNLYDDYTCRRFMEWY